MKVAVVGLGNIGSAVARNLVNGKVEIIVADRTIAKAESLARELGDTASATTVDNAIRETDVLILAIYLDAMKELIAAHHVSLDGKIIVDPSNPIAPDGHGGFSKTIPETQSSGELVAALLPDGAQLVKAFGTLSAGSLAQAASRAPERAVLFYATDYPEAGQVVAALIEASGFSPVAVGGVKQSIRIEVGGDLHEMGKIGRLVSVAEAEALLH